MPRAVRLGRLSPPPPPSSAVTSGNPRRCAGPHGPHACVDVGAARGGSSSARRSHFRSLCTDTLRARTHCIRAPRTSGDGAQQWLSFVALVSFLVSRPRVCMRAGKGEDRCCHRQCHGERGRRALPFIPFFLPRNNPMYAPSFVHRWRIVDDAIGRRARVSRSRMLLSKAGRRVRTVSPRIVLHVGARCCTLAESPGGGMRLGGCQLFFSLFLFPSPRGAEGGWANSGNTNALCCSARVCVESTKSASTGGRECEAG